MNLKDGAAGEQGGIIPERSPCNKMSLG
jgi:hypothetical protein